EQNDVDQRDQGEQHRARPPEPEQIPAHEADREHDPERDLAPDDEGRDVVEHDLRIARTSPRARRPMGGRCLITSGDADPDPPPVVVESLPWTTVNPRFEWDS